MALRQLMQLISRDNASGYFARASLERLSGSAGMEGDGEWERRPAGKKKDKDVMYFGTVCILVRPLRLQVESVV